MKSVLLVTNIVGSSNQAAILESFVSELNGAASSTSYDFCAVQELVFAVTEKGGISITRNGHEIAESYTTVHVRNVQSFTDYANALRLYANARGLELINSADATYPYLGKVSQGFLFTLNDIPTPSFVSSPSNATLGAAVDALYTDYPLVIKHNEGVMGLHNYLVHDKSEKDAALTQQKQHYIAQPFIVNMGEYRVLTFGEQLDPLVFLKRAGEGSHLNNTSRGGKAELVDVSTMDKTILEDAMKAARLTGRDIGGVDVLLAKDGKHYILEVNTTPQLAMGAFAHLKREYYMNFYEQKGDN